MPALPRIANLFLLMLVFSQPVFAQLPNRLVNAFPSTAQIPFSKQKLEPGLFGTSRRYIENIGQYGDTHADFPQLGKIRYAFEGFGMPILFTSKGMVLLDRKINFFSEKELEAWEKSGKLNSTLEEEEGGYYTDKEISMQWIGANPDPIIEALNPSDHYYSYAQLPGKAKGFQQLRYKDLYPGIDMILSFSPQQKTGFEYSFIIKPGIDPTIIKFRFGGEIKKLETDKNGNLVVRSEIGGFVQEMPKAFYYDSKRLDPIQPPSDKEQIKAEFKVIGNDMMFVLPGGYNKNRTLVIDPFVSSANNLAGVNEGMAKDIDFDYHGNIYIAGGGSTFTSLLAKYNSSGVLQWTFSGTLTTPSWVFGGNYGGWVVEKTTGKIYLGQGGSGAFQVIRLNTDGLYDNYITTRDPLFQENWKMIWNCDGGNPEILIAGGGTTTQNVNLVVFSPPGTTLSPLNITGQPTGHQDIADLVIDPKTNELYTIFAQNFVTPITENNRIYKHRQPYNAVNRLWHRLSGFSVLSERANRPYLAAGLGFSDNSINGLAVNSNYLFYYDGKNMVAINKANGLDLSSPVSQPLNTPLMQGGIIADECNNVYIGSINGTIKVYKFNGSGFDDGAVADISIAGYPTASVFDLAYDNARNMLYASGHRFVAAIDISPNCASAIYSLAVTQNCAELSAQATLTPAGPPGSTVTFELYDGTNLVSSNSTGLFTSLAPGIFYTMKALIDEKCSGTHSMKNFRLDCAIGGQLPGSGIYVPTGFTPNNDGLNDILKAIPFGVKEFRSFSLYNRWGQLVFRTTDYRRGWDGTIQGKLQDAGVFVWIAEAIGLDDKLIQVKGTTTLIR